jgi:16S rRNA (uracil1498-N3)-methyltransferase
VSSAKQCGRAVIPAVRNAIRFTEALAAATNMESEGFSPARPVVLLVEPQAGDGARSLRDLPRSQALFLLVGPEGGWTAGEVQQARAAGAMLVTLGTQVLRADAAPMVAMTAVRVAFGDF